MGATGFGYDLARQFGLNIVQPRPALVPLVFNRAIRTATGPTSPASPPSPRLIASTGTHQPPSFREKMLITHRGLSGPAILQISSYWQPRRQPIHLDLAPSTSERPRILTSSPDRRRDQRHDLPPRHLARPSCPQRLADRWLDLAPAPRLDQRRPRRLRTQPPHHWPITPAGTEGYAKAEVTAGGIDTADLDANTMEARNVPGLFFIGEVVDVTGQLGGFNFQWAWASAAAAGRAI